MEIALQGHYGYRRLTVSSLPGGRLRLTLRRGIPAQTDLTVSRSRADAFLAWLEG